jgi:cytochrome c
MTKVCHSERREEPGRAGRAAGSSKPRPSPRSLATLGMTILLALLGISCTRSEMPGDVQRGQQLIAQYGCNVCHTSPGISGPHGSIGPDLTGVALRPTISNGHVQNTPENLAKFVQSPPSMNPSTNMPGLNLPINDAQDIAAYLRTLK